MTRGRHWSASSRPTWSGRGGPGHDGRRYRFTHALVHEVVYENLLLSRRTELHERAGRALEAGRRPVADATERSRGAGPPLELHVGQGQGRPLPGGRRRLGARRLRQRRRHPPLRACAGHARELPGLRRPGPDRARAAGRPAGAHRQARRRPGALRGGSRRSSRRSAIAQAPRACTARSAGCTGRPAIASAPAPASTRASSGWARRRSDRARAAVPGDRAARLSRRRQRRRHRLGRAGARRGGERRTARRRSTCERVHEAAAMRRRPTTRWAWRWRAWAGSGGRRPQSSRASRWPRTHDLLQAACRGYTNLGVLYSSLDPQRSIETCLARTRDRARRSAISASSRGCTPTSPWPTVR